jgi:hypothetical protein
MIMTRITLLKKLNTRERQFLANFMMSNCNNEYSYVNFESDVGMYQYPHANVLMSLFPEYIGKHELLKNDLESLVVKKCENHAHHWKTKKVYWDLNAKDVKCSVCGEERHVEIDSELGGSVI